jgi:hypothetical protein
MRDPARLDSGGGATDFEKRLLQSAKEETMPPEMKRRMRRALGLSGGLAAGAWLGMAKASLVVWMSAGIVALGVGGGMLGARIAGHGAPVVTAPASLPAPSAAHPDVEPSSASGPPSFAEMASVRVPLSPASSPAAIQAAPRFRRAITEGSAGDLRAEITLIDGARDALASRSTARALALLRRYGARFPEGALAPEGMALRIEALEQDGRHPDALELARRFVATHPNSPLVERIARFRDGGPIR